VLLGELHIPQELGIASFHAHVPLGAGLLNSTPVVLAGLVMSGVFLGIGHVVPSLVSETSDKFHDGEMIKGLKMDQAEHI